MLPNINKEREFLLFRYFLTIDEVNFTPGLFDDIKTSSDLNDAKQLFFRKALEEIIHEGQEENEASEDSWRKRNCTFYKWNTPEIDCYLFAARKQLTKTIERDFKNFKVPHQPSAWIAVDSHPDYQVIAIEKKAELANLDRDLERLLYKKLKSNFIMLKIEAIKDNSSFWKFIKAHKEEIKSLHLVLNAPNMPNVSACMTSEIKGLMKSTNAKDAAVTINAEKGSHLIINKENKSIVGMVKYISLGGGECKFKVKGESKLRKPSNNQTTTTAVLRDERSPELFHDEECSSRDSILTKIRKLCKL